MNHATRIIFADLVQIVEAGMAAPSGKNAQTTEFVIIDDQAIIDKIRAMQIKYAEDGAQDPMGKMANEMASRYAAMGDLEKILLGLVDKANGEIREEKTGER